MTNTNRPIRRALVSVFHKEGIEVLAEAFIKAGTEVVSTVSRRSTRTSTPASSPT